MNKEYLHHSCPPTCSMLRQLVQKVVLPMSCKTLVVLSTSQKILQKPLPHHGSISRADATRQLIGQINIEPVRFQSTKLR